MNERRTAERKPVSKGALVYLGADRGVFAGMVLDASDAGIKIQLGELTIPKRFSLSFDNFLTIRNCRVTWRKRGFAGIVFEAHAKTRGMPPNW